MRLPAAPGASALLDEVEDHAPLRPEALADGERLLVEAVALDVQNAVSSFAADFREEDEAEDRSRSGR